MDFSQRPAFRPVLDRDSSAFGPLEVQNWHGSALRPRPHPTPAFGDTLEIIARDGLSLVVSGLAWTRCNGVGVLELPRCPPLNRPRVGLKCRRCPGQP
jgi:hypothetical protein